MKRLLRSTLALALLTASASAGDVQIVVRGTVSNDLMSSGPYLFANNGDPVVVTFEVDLPGTVFNPGQLVGYAIDVATFSIDINGPTPSSFSAMPSLTIENSATLDGFSLPSSMLTNGYSFRCEFQTGPGFFPSVDLSQLFGLYDVAANQTSLNFLLTGAGGFMGLTASTLQISGVAGPPVAYCFGDGGDQMGCTNCPCGNNAGIGSGGGCLNSSGNGAQLLASGTPDVTLPADTLHFDLVGGTVSSFGLLFSGDNRLPAMGACPPGSGVTSGTLDGLRCMGGNAIRHGSRALDAAGATTNGWGPPAAPAAGLGVTAGFTSGQTRHFQVFLREMPTAGCMTGVNTSNGVSITFV